MGLSLASRRSPRPTWSCSPTDALYVREISELIVGKLYGEGLGKGSVASLARTCKAFMEPAVAVLWKQMDSIVPLMRLLPGDIWCEELVSTTEGKIMKQIAGLRCGASECPDLHRLQTYCELIEKFTWDHNLDVSLEALKCFIKILPKPFKLFPRLRSFTWFEPETRPYIHLIPTGHFVNSRLEELRLSGTISNLRSIAYTLEEVRQKCESLKVLEVAGDWYSGIVPPRQSRHIEGVMRSRDLCEFRSQCPISWDSILLLAAAPGLEHIAVHLDTRATKKVADVFELPEHSFLGVKTFKLTVQRMCQASLALIVCVQSENVEHFGFNSIEPPVSAETVEMHLEAISHARFHMSIKQLDLTLGQASSSPRDHEVTMDNLYYLLRINDGLEILNIDAYRLQVDFEGVAQFTKAFEQLKSLRLMPTGLSQTNGTGAPLSALMLIAGRCSRLKSLALAVDGRYCPPIPPRCKSTSDVEHIELLVSGTGGHLVNASKYVSKMFPNFASPAKRVSGVGCSVRSVLRSICGKQAKSPIADLQLYLYGPTDMQPTCGIISGHSGESDGLPRAYGSYV